MSDSNINLMTIEYQVHSHLDNHFVMYKIFITILVPTYINLNTYVYIYYIHKLHIKTRCNFNLEMPLLSYSLMTV